jgi:hypothetical protein
LTSLIYARPLSTVRHFARRKCCGLPLGSELRFAQYPIESIASPVTRYGLISTVFASRPHRESGCSYASLGVVPIGRALKPRAIVCYSSSLTGCLAQLYYARMHAIPCVLSVHWSYGARNWHRWPRRPIATALSRACAIRCVSHDAAQATARDREARTWIGRSRDPTEHSALRTHILRGSIGEIPSLVSEAPPLIPREIATTEKHQNDLDSVRARV